MLMERYEVRSRFSLLTQRHVGTRYARIRIADRKNTAEDLYSDM